MDSIVNVVKIVISEDEIVQSIETLEITESKMEELEIGEAGTEFLYDEDGSDELYIQNSMAPEKCSLCNDDNEVYMYFGRELEDWIVESFKAGRLKFSPM